LLVEHHAESELALGQQGRRLRVLRLRALQRQRFFVVPGGLVVGRLQRQDVAQVIQRLGQLHGIGIAQFAPLRHGGIQQRLRLVVEAQAHVDRANGVE
jgi:hypothetical protein